jgi:SAM-dependent methyltransferase
MSTACAICDSQNVSLEAGLVAPFLAHRIWNQGSRAANLVTCGDCGFAFFIPRLSGEEEGRLYRSYRGSDYLAERNSFEPWYTKKLNDGLTSNATMHNRRRIVGDILKAQVPLETVSTVLDFGGGRGELVDGLVPGAKAAVYDIADVNSLPNIDVTHLGEKKSFDLILCSNVLEHVASPRELLNQILSFSKPGSFVFVEVPNESPSTWKTKVKRLAQLGVLSLTRTTQALSLVRYGTLNVMHEHLNFYTERAMSALFQGAGVAPISHGWYGETFWMIGKAR